MFSIVICGLFLFKVLKYAYSLWDIKKDQKFRIQIEDIFGKQGVDVVTILEDIELKGQIKKDQDTLIRLMNKKYRLTNKEIQLIKSIHDIDKLDRAIDELFFSDSKKAVLSILKHN